MHGQALVLMDDSLPIADKIDVMATPLSHFDLEGVYLPPLVRARIEAARDDGMTAGQ